MKELVEQAKHIVIFTHMAPDGDAMGSALAIYHSIKNKEHGAQTESVHVIVPNAFPAFFNWMPEADKILIYEKQSKECDPIIAAADLFICTDFNDPKRIGPMGDKLLANPCRKILIDHHIMANGAWLTENDEVHSHPDASSSCEIVYKVLTEDGTESTEQRAQNKDLITQDIATCIYTGLMTDTGNFTYNSTNCALYDIVAALIRAGVQKDAIYDAVFNQYSTDRMRLIGYALHRKMRIYPEYHLALIILSADELERYHYQAGDCEGLVNMPLQIADVRYSVFMREERPKPGTPKSRIRISFRSQGDRPVNVWAAEIFHGGGHANASGGELFGSINQAVKLFEDTFPKYILK